MITLNFFDVTLYFYKNMFNVSIVRIKYARSTIGYSEAAAHTNNVPYMQAGAHHHSSSFMAANVAKRAA